MHGGRGGRADGHAGALRRLIHPQSRFMQGAPPLPPAPPWRGGKLTDARWRGAGAVMVAQSGVLLLYTAVIVPIQLFLWNYEDPCNTFPTLYFDLFVDLFFLVPKAHAHTCV